MHGDLGFIALPEDLMAQLKSFTKAAGKLEQSLSSDKRKRDELMLQSLVAALKMRLAEYPTSSKADQAQLELRGISYRMRMATEVRLGEKQLLQEALSFTEDLLREKEGQLDRDDGQQKRRRTEK